MLKKLVKYGNSNALILDRSILALLEITEGSVVKLRIEGDTLMIKAEKNIKPTDAMMIEMESLEEKMIPGTVSSSPLMEVAKKNTRDFCSKIEKDPNSVELLKNWIPGSENYKRLQEEYTKIIQKYQEDLKALSSQEFQEELQNLNKKYKNEMNSSEYSKEFLEMRAKFCPKLLEMDKEMQEINKALGYPDQLNFSSLN